MAGNSLQGAVYFLLSFSCRLKIALLIFVSIAGIAGIALIALTRGPEGTAVGKEIEDRISAAAAECDLELHSATAVSPATVRLSARACLKHQLKTFGRRIGVLYQESDSAKDYLLGQSTSDVAIHCLSRVSGDHVIGIDVRFTPAHRSIRYRLRDALQKQFRRDILSLIVTEKT
jgi:hypothetical protein